MIPNEVSNLLVEDIVKPFVSLRDRLKEVEIEIRRIEISMDNNLAVIVDLIRYNEEKRTKMLDSFREMK